MVYNDGIMKKEYIFGGHKDEVYCDAGITETRTLRNAMILAQLQYKESPCLPLKLLILVVDRTATIENLITGSRSGNSMQYVHEIKKTSEELRKTAMVYDRVIIIHKNLVAEFHNDHNWLPHNGTQIGKHTRIPFAFTSPFSLEGNSYHVSNILMEDLGESKNECLILRAMFKSLIPAQPTRVIEFPPPLQGDEPPTPRGLLPIFPPPPPRYTAVV